MPSGGRGALLFWGGLCVLLAFGLVWVYGSLVSQEKAVRLLRDQQQILTAENQQLRSQIDRIQGQLSQEGNALKNAQQVLQAVTQTPVTPQQQADFQLALTKAFVSQDGLTIWTEGDSVRVRILDSDLFDGTDAALNKKGEVLVRKLADLLKAAPAGEDVWVESFLDNPPVGAKASTFFNPWELSLHRGAAVARILGEATDPARVSLRAYGAAKPLVTNGADRSKNRRIELTFRAK
jgi:flagellar motor protein MotB